MLGYKRPLIDPTKYDSVKELNEALPALLDKKFKYELYWSFVASWCSEFSFI
jgi:hypothetical protein